jgi:hypothetical protein
MQYVWLYLNENAAAPADDGTAFISYLGYDGYAQNSRWVEMGSDFRSVLYQPLGSATKTTVSFSQGEVDALASTTTCTDRIKNGDETRVDCGGSCPPCGDPCKTGTHTCGIGGACKTVGTLDFTCECKSGYAPIDNGKICNASIPEEYNDAVHMVVVVDVAEAQLVWEDVRAAVAGAMEVGPHTLNLVSSAETSQDSDQTEVQFEVGPKTDMTDSMVIRRQQLLQSKLNLQDANLLQSKILSSRVVAATLEVDTSGMPPWIIVGFIFTAFIFLVCIYIEW